MGRPIGLTREDVDKLFKWKEPGPGQGFHCREVREDARRLAHTILRLVPAGPDQTAAIRKLRECVWTANSAIVQEGTEEF